MAGITYPAFSGPVADLGTILTASGATTAQVSTDIPNGNFRATKVALNLTAVTTSVVLVIQGKDSVSGLYYPILTSTAVSATGLTIYTVLPAGPVSANSYVNDFIPAWWRVTVTPTGAATFTVGAVVV